jgi:hypothetical protein
MYFNASANNCSELVIICFGLNGLLRDRKLEFSWRAPSVSHQKCAIVDGYRKFCGLNFSETGNGRVSKLV